MPAKVAIVQRRLTQYRIPLFETLREELTACGIQFQLLFGQGTTEENRKHDAGNLDWATQIATRYWMDGRLCWQPLFRYINDADLVILTQENRLLYNHWLLMRWRQFRLAFWGHGANLQSNNPNGLKERYKRWTTNQVDWWFAYTQLSANLVMAAGFPESRITVLNNAADTSELHRLLKTVTSADTRHLREALGFGIGPVGVFVGSLYKDKRLDYLFEAAKAIREYVPDFHLLIVGDGPDRDKAQAWCAKNSWIRWVGSRVGRDKVAYVSMAQIMLNPGAVGLGILDSFVLCVPMLTTDCGIHGPEIAYLKHGVNGVMTANDLSQYVGASVQLLRNNLALDALRNGCAISAMKYTVENMASRFTDGIIKALS